MGVPPSMGARVRPGSFGWPGRRRRAALACFALGGGAVLAGGQGLDAQDTHILFVAGLGGEPRYTEAFHAWISRFADAASEKYGVPAGRIAYLGESPDLDPARISARSTAENIRAALAAMASSMAPADPLVVFLAGHGTFRNGEARFNLPGPDLSPGDFAFLLEPFGARPISFVNTASASGPFLGAISGPNRIVVTATRSGRERNLTRFGLHFADAFAGEDADADKNGRVSMLEAFAYAAREVEREYETDRQLLTEHAMLDDDGDGEGSREPGDGASDGQLARRMFLGAGTEARSAVASDPALRALLEEKAQIEAGIQALRAAKAQMPLREYEDELETLLVQLAFKNRAIRAAGGR